ncbi:uncharacterized protein N7484_008930 [Penicillium longicatenatum]|uniref:uncharacterized protein n=1 Tax=Penicillium longicatenatum TaxID=1561947 RepID=UPI0025488A09|nr:uncharacterized protein N7484_008930 [Penicillium longicatenatum]KAJ5635617.1 hypothetical protein N7484_008930 [Penicillium longicatenatum]
MTEFHIVNSNDLVPGAEAPPPEFSLRAPPATDVWSKPPSTNAFNAPIFYQSISLNSFKRARVAVAAQWTQKYDQGGLIIVLNNVDGSQKWVKTGIELTNDKPHLNVVAKDRWADWSLLPVPSGGKSATLELVREADNSLWIYLVEGVQKKPIREVTWIFEETNVQETWVGVYAARPSTEGGELIVHFGHLIIESVGGKE